MSRKIGDPLTARQQQILDAIRSHLLSHGVPPTIRELCKEFGFVGPHAAVGHLNALIDKGKIRRLAGSTSRNHVPIVPRGCCPTCGQRIDATHSQTIKGNHDDIQCREDDH